MRSRIQMRATALVLFVSALAGCGNTARPTADAPATEPSSSAAPAGQPPAAPSAQPTAVPSTTAQASAAAPSSADVDAGAAPAPIVADNKVAPTEGPELQARAKGLFDAIVKDDPARAEDFWFPREPFIPLKDIKDPGKYWNQLHRTYGNDVHALHKKRKSWDGAEFVSFEGWSRPKWVPPGDEANKIGYHRAFNGRLRYKVGGEDAEIEVHTLITWQGRWFVTHLRRVKH